MKFAASNIAWRAAEDAEVVVLLKRYGFEGIEIAPTRIWQDPLRATPSQVREVRATWTDQGLPIVAMQSLLFGHPELTLFESKEIRQKTREYLARMIDLGAGLGARVLVFGSPKNRQRAGLPVHEALAIAADFFRDLGNRAHAAGVALCVEPNPALYACDFVTTSREGLALVDAVQSPGFGLHLDAAGMTLAGETPDALEAVAGSLEHFHASEKNLDPVGSGTVDHAGFSAALQKIHYNHWVSIEMRPGEGSNLPRIEQALRHVQSLYGR